MPFDSSKNKIVVAAANTDTTITVGTPAASLADVTASHNQTILNSNFATLGTELNEIKAALRAAGILASNPEPEMVPVGPVFTTTGVSFAPEVELVEGSTAEVHWYVAGTQVATGMAPTLSFGSASERYVTMAVVRGGQWAHADVVSINLGFDHGADAGRYNAGAGYDKAPEAVAAVTGLTYCTGLVRFLAGGTALGGTLDCTGLSELEYIECYGANVSDLVLTGCTSLVRLCMEANRLTTLNLNPVASALYDLRAAAQQGGSLALTALTSPMAHLYHLCIRDQTVTGMPSASDLPAVEEYWTWGDHQSGTLTLPPVATSALSASNSWTAVTDAGRTASGGGFDLSGCAIASVTLTSHWYWMDLSNNSLDQTSVDAVLATVVAWAQAGGVLDLSGNVAPSSTGLADVATLQAAGWTVTVDAEGGGGVLWQDLFDRADCTGLASVGNGWHSTNSDANIVSGDLVRTSGSAWGWVLNPAGGNLPADCVVEVTMDSTSMGTYWGLIGRWGSGNGVRVMFNDGRTDLYVGDASGFSAGNVTVTPVDGFPSGWSNSGSHVLAMHMHGSTIDVYCDGQHSHTATVTTNQALVGGEVGLCGEVQNRPWHQIRVLDAIA